MKQQLAGTTHGSTPGREDRSATARRNLKTVRDTIRKNLEIVKKKGKLGQFVCHAGFQATMLLFSDSLRAGSSCKNWQIQTECQDKTFETLPGDPSGSYRDTGNLATVMRSGRQRKTHMEK